MSNYSKAHLDLLTRFDWLNWTAKDVDIWIRKHFRKGHPCLLSKEQVKQAMEMLKPENRKELDQDAMGTCEID